MLAAAFAELFANISFYAIRHVSDCTLEKVVSEAMINIACRKKAQRL